MWERKLSDPLAKIKIVAKEEEKKEQTLLSDCFFFYLFLKNYQGRGFWRK